ncbi:MAG TPA: hypothetical protein VEK78_00995 [Gemmatimonadales bacterium]|nr:hypothetical protein [Gemmatimonadales bacterium]HYT84529.1 hypothetical protein [Gemmatimonadales bacterium]
MRAKWLWVTVLAALGAGCGEGHAIFVVDVYSFIKGSGADTSDYFILPASDSASSTPRRIDLPGAGSSIVDSATVNGRVNFENDSGSGSIGLQMYLAADSVGTYDASALAFTVPQVAVSGAATVPDTILGRLDSAVLSLLAGAEMWVRFRAQGTNSGLTLVQGSAVLKSLVLTVAVNDKLF